MKGTVTDYTYNAAGQLVKKVSGKEIVTYTYDVNGNLIRESNNGKLCAKYDKTFTYNNENRLEAVKNNGKLLMAALYDGDNERIFVVSDRDGCGMPCVNDKNCSNLKKNENGIDFDEELIKNTMLIPNGVDCKLEISQYDFTGYVNNINAEYTQVLMEYGANNKICAAFEYGVFRESAEIDGKDYFYEYDGRGSVIGIANSTGMERETYKYDPYGNTTTSGLKIANPYQYNAEYTDATGYQYLRARYYRAETGSFITADTYAGNITNPLSLNRYAYAHNNPIMGKDPSGHFLGTFLLVTAIVTVVAGGVAYGANKASQSKTRQAQEKKVERQNVETNRVTASANATSTAPSKSSSTSISGKSVNYKNRVYSFKTEAEAREYFNLCNTLDALDKDIVKLEKSAATWSTVGKVSSTVAMVGGAVGAVGAVVATGGTALAPLLGNLGVSAGLATGLSYGVSAVAVTSTVGSTTMNVTDTWADIDDPTFNAWQKGLNITSTASNIAYSVGNIYNSVKGINSKEWVAKSTSDNASTGSVDTSSKTKTGLDEIYEGKKTLKSNIEYESPNGGKYTTNSEGKIDTFELDDLNFDDAARNNYAQRQVGHSDALRPKNVKVSYEIDGQRFNQTFDYSGSYESYDGGHILGNQFGGSGSYDNLFSQPSISNRAGGDWWKMEQSWADALKNGGSVKNIKMKFTY